MSRDKHLQVKYHDRIVGTLAETADHRIAFEYDDAWISNGFPISPFSLPLRKEVFVPGKNFRDGLFGVFRDSLPDAWGSLLIDRMLRRRGIDPAALSALDRLAVIGDSGMGALTYVPKWDMEADVSASGLDELAIECGKILEHKGDEDIDTLFRLGGSSGGARPKVLMNIDGREWLVKFPFRMDRKDIGIQEYEYSVAARSCGINMSETKLFDSAICPGYFGTVRFDRIHNGSGGISLSGRAEEQETPESSARVHMITAEAILETDYTLPNLDYRDLMKLTRILTFNNKEELRQMYRRMCFNVFAHNRDDHSKNFAFIYDEVRERYRLSPAYDLTYSTTYYGEHTTSVGGNAADPGMEDLIRVGTEAGLDKRECRKVAEKVAEIAVPLAVKWSEA